jgi:uncharacterized protein YcfJ
MKKLLVTAFLLLFSISTFGSTVYVEVISVERLSRTVVSTRPVTDCSYQPVRHHRHRNQWSDNSKRVLGAIIGGSIGHAVGHSNSNKKAGAVVGAILGGTIAGEHRSRPHYRRSRSQCSTVYRHHEYTVDDGYLVKYVYNGEVYTAHTDRHPGDRMRVAVSLSPIN